MVKLGWAFKFKTESKGQKAKWVRMGRETTRATKEPLFAGAQDKVERGVQVRSGLSSRPQVWVARRKVCLEESPGDPSGRSHKRTTKL